MYLQLTNDNNNKTSDITNLFFVHSKSDKNTLTQHGDIHEMECVVCSVQCGKWQSR